MSKDLSNVPFEVLIRTLWERGDMTMFLHDGQREIHEKFLATTGKKFVVCCSRRYGKSWYLCAEALSQAFRQPKSQIRYAAPTAKMVKNIVVPHLKNMLELCPEDMRPEFKSQDGVWLFPNGSEIHVSGCDNQGAERLRGTSTDLALIDEAGFIQDLEYVVQAVLLPQTITTGGRILIASTPPKSPAHHFTRYATDAEARGLYVHKTIYDAPHITPEMVAEYIDESGGEHTSTWRREYLSEFVVDENIAVIPEFSEHRSTIVQEFDSPDIIWDKYVAVDLGYTDLTFAVFAQYNFEEAKLYILDEVVMERSNSRQVDEAIGDTEHRLWGDEEVFRRVADAPLMGLADLSAAGRKYGLPAKVDKEASINSFRLLTQKGGYVIHPRCKSLIAHLSNAIWNGSRTSFARSGDCGHFDGVDAMLYLNRAIHRRRNPVLARPLADNEFMTRRGQRERGPAVTNMYKGRRKKKL